jgi:transposase
MYIRTVKNSAGQAYYQVVESYWSEGRSRQRLILSLGRVGEDGEKKLDELATAISKYRDTLTIAQLAKEICVEQTFILGPLLVLERMFELIGINEIIGAIKLKHPQMEIDLHKALFTVIVSRFVKPGSKLKIFEHWRKVLYPEMIDPNLPLHHLYRTLDLLAEHKEEIEESLYWRGRDLLSQPTDIVLYDLTTLRFESTKKVGLRQFGYSKEMRSDCTQVVFGLLLNTTGVPLGFEVYPGNTFEGNTLQGIVEKMRKKFRIRRMIFVADRGLFSNKNLEFLRADDGEFIVGCKLGTMKQAEQQELYDLKRFDWIIPDDLAVLETKTENGDRLIVTWSRVRAERDEKIRADILSKIERKISAKKKITPKVFVSNTNYQKFLTGLDEGGTPKLNLDAIASAAKKDGFFAIVTNVKDITASEAVTNYKELWKIEDAFGELKGTLKTRPVFHWTDKRITGHLVACFLAYLCEAHITKLLREKNLVLKSAAIDRGQIKPRAITVPEALKALNEVRAVPVKIRGKTIWYRTDITGNAVTILRAVGAQIPAKILKTLENPADTKHN